MSAAVQQSKQVNRGHSFEHIPYSKVVESKHNPRRHFDDARLAELSDSIKKVGIITPILVRPIPVGMYEIAAGHRRYRASKSAGLDMLPCNVVDMDDQTFMEVLTIENLQREDVHPLDEAKGYEALMAAPYRMDVAKIAEKVGRSIKYIWDRKKLLDLTKAAQELFWDGTIQAGHAILLARLSPEEQAKVIGKESNNYGDGGLLQLTHDLYAEDEGRDEPEFKAVSVRELESWIKRNIRFNAKKAESFLFPETVSQVTQATEGKKKIIEITREYIASDEVRQAGDTRVFGERAWKRADGKEDSKTCERSVLGVIASGHGQGEAFQVCINKDKCSIHWGDVIKAREKRAKATPAEREKADVKQEAENKKREEAYELERRKRAEWGKLIPAIMKMVDAQLLNVNTKARGPLADLLVEALGDWGRSKTTLKRGTSETDLIRYLSSLALHHACRQWQAYEDFPKIAKTIGIDLSKVLPAEPVHTSAQKKAEAVKSAQQAEVQRENKRGNAKGRAIEKRRAKKKGK